MWKNRKIAPYGRLEGVDGAKMPDSSQLRFCRIGRAILQTCIFDDFLTIVCLTIICYIMLYYVILCYIILYATIGVFVQKDAQRNFMPNALVDGPRSLIWSSLMQKTN